MKRTRTPATQTHPLTLCGLRGHNYRLTTGVWTCTRCGDEVDRDCRVGCVFAADGINCEDVVRCAREVATT